MEGGVKFPNMSPLEADVKAYQKGLSPWDREQEARRGQMSRITGLTEEYTHRMEKRTPGAKGYYPSLVGEILFVREYHQDEIREFIMPVMSMMDDANDLAAAPDGTVYQMEKDLGLFFTLRLKSEPDKHKKTYPLLNRVSEKLFSHNHKDLLPIHAQPLEYPSPTATSPVVVILSTVSEFLPADDLKGIADKLEQQLEVAR